MTDTTEYEGTADPIQCYRSNNTAWFIARNKPEKRNKKVSLIYLSGIMNWLTSTWWIWMLEKWSILSFCLIWVKYLEIKGGQKTSFRCTPQDTHPASRASLKFAKERTRRGSAEIVSGLLQCNAPYRGHPTNFHIWKPRCKYKEGLRFYKRWPYSTYISTDLTD